MRPLVPATVLSLLLCAAPAAAGWSPDRPQTHAGRVTGVEAAGGKR
ncbi:MAG: hypothetical protein H0V81_12820 [Solirubrobacterales bacterium]|nr:hypothetical protein [Solirubrobacterales bacterium]